MCQNTLEGFFFLGIKAFKKNRVPLSPLKTLLKNHTQFKISCFLLIRSLLRQETSMAAIFSSFPGSPGLFHCTCASAAHDGSPPVCHCNNTSTLTSFWGKGQRARIWKVQGSRQCVDTDWYVLHTDCLLQVQRLYSHHLQVHYGLLESQ